MLNGHCAGAQGQAVPDLMGDLLDLGDDSAPSHIADTQNFAAQPEVGKPSLLRELVRTDRTCWRSALAKIYPDNTWKYQNL